MRKHIFWLNFILIIFILAGLVFLGRHRITDVWEQWMEDPAPPAVNYDAFRNVDTEPDTVDENVNTDPVAEPEPVAIPDELNLNVPFTTQAPHANWDYPYQEACEEASAITVHYYYQSQTFTPEIADKEILDLVAWEEEHLGFYKDTTAAETAQFIRDYWGYDRVDVIQDPSVDDIKRHIAAGRPVIIPAAGKQLGNPNFRSGGPLYHMFVVRGYTTDTFITNDVGTRKGENYVYDIDVVMEAMHDWNGGDVDMGAKVVIVVYPND